MNPAGKPSRLMDVNLWNRTISIRPEDKKEEEKEWSSLSVRLAERGLSKYAPRQKPCASSASLSAPSLEGFSVKLISVMSNRGH